MLEYGRGKAAAASTGIAVGRVQKIVAGRSPVPEFYIEAGDVSREIERLHQAIQDSIAQLEQQQASLADVRSKDPAHILDAHCMLLQDPELTNGARKLIDSKHINAEWALSRQLDVIEAIFDDIEDEYLRSKKSDVEQVGQRVLNNLADSRDMDFGQHDQATILVGESFSPSDAVHIWHQGLAGFVAEKGGANSHTVIVARGVGLPALIGATGIRERAKEGDTLVINGNNNEWILNPDEEELARYRNIASEIHASKSDLMSFADLPSISADGQALPLMANMEFIEELPLAREIGVDGIGLYRTEFLFLNSTSPPDEEEQFVHYRQIVQGMQGKPVTFRLLDIGGDKQALFEHMSGHAWMGDNPAMGMRGIRLLLHCPDILRTQLRALVRASAEGPLDLLIPMVVSVEEVQQTRAMLDECRRELDIHTPTPLGTMIEIPAAALIAEELAEVSDFFSVGTNDLIQYTLATDRADEEVAGIYNPSHHAIYRLLELAVQGAKKKGIPIAMCGELAADPQWSETLLRMGFDSLSMSLSNILPTRKRLRELCANKDCQED